MRNRRFQILRSSLWLLTAAGAMFTPALAAGPLSFIHVGHEQGLSQSSVICLFQDRTGFVWFGTTDGLFRFDGFTCREFRHRDGDSTSISSGYVSGFAQDRDGYIWIATNGGGLNRYDPRTELFSTFIFPDESAEGVGARIIGALNLDPDGRLWFLRLNGIRMVDTKTFRSVIYPFPQSHLRNGTGINIGPIVREEDGTFHVAGDTWVDRFNPADGSFLREFVDTASTPRLNAHVILGMTRARDGKLWIGSYDGGVTVFDPRTGASKRFRHSDNDITSLANDIVYNIWEHPDGTFWCSTRGGLDIYDPATNRFTHNTHDPRNSRSIASNNLSQSYQDHDGNIWVATYGGGVSRVDRRNKFTLYTSDPHDPNSLSNNFVYPILVDRKGILWVGTLGGGLNRFDREKGTVTVYRHDLRNSNSLSYDDVRSIYEAKDGTLWIGTHSGGLDRFTPSTGIWKHSPFDSTNPMSVTGKIVRRIYEDRFGNIWIATGDHGFGRYNRSTGGWISYRNNPSDSNSLAFNDVQMLYRDRRGMLWIGMQRHGLDRYDPSNGAFKHYVHSDADASSLSQNTIWYAYEDTTLDADTAPLWFGTDGGGLERFDRISGRFRHFTAADGLPNNVVYNIVPDESGQLWISTNKGLARIDPITMRVRVFTTDDGLQGDEFNSQSVWKTPEGEIFFGGVNGFNSFFPRLVADNPHAPPVVITSISIYNDPLSSDTSAGFLKSLVLRHDRSFISFEFAGLDYLNPALNRFSYRMEGFDPEWNNAGVRRFASYTNLPPGTYVFKVRASNNDGVWNNEGASLQITVLPPFWRTWWFIVIAAAAAAGTLGAAVRYLATRTLKEEIRRLEQERMLTEERERTRDRIARDLHDEVASTIGSIALFASTLSDSAEDRGGEQRRLLKKVSDLALNAEDAMGDIVWAVSPNRDSLPQLILRIRTACTELADATGIRFSVDAPGNAPPLRLNDVFRKNVYLIAKEAMHNVVRHSGAAAARLTIAICEGSLTLEISDDGRGFEQPPVAKEGRSKGGHGLDNMHVRAGEIGAKLDIISAPSRGTTVTVTVKMT